MTWTAEEFTRMLRDEGYGEIVEVRREPNRTLALHAHPFEVKALVLEGEIRLEVDGTPADYRPGDVFALAQGCEHVEQYGPAGVRYLVGRR